MAAIQRLSTRLFGQLFSRSISDYRHMQIARCRIAKQLLQIDLPCGGFQQIGAANDIRYALFCVIHYHGQLIGPEAIRAFEHEVTCIRR